jgi:tetratricopeptide (TPR) repeat protein
MVNEHRPYLPLALLSICWVVPLGAWALRAGRPRVIAAGGLAAGIAIVAFSGLTLERNRVFDTWGTYWTDVVDKAPSWRSHLNLGVHFLRTERIEQAKEQFEQSLHFAPRGYNALSNLGALYGRQGLHDLAMEHFERAIQSDRYTSIAREARAAHLLLTKDWLGAIADLEVALHRTRRPFEVHRGLAMAKAGLGRWEESVAHTLICRDLAPDRISAEIVVVANPFWSNQRQAQRGLAYFSALAEAWPGQWWVHANKANLARMLKLPELAGQEQRRAEELNTKRGN